MTKIQVKSFVKLFYDLELKETKYTIVLKYLSHSHEICQFHFSTYLVKQLKINKLDDMTSEAYYVRNIHLELIK